MMKRFIIWVWDGNINMRINRIYCIFISLIFFSFVCDCHCEMNDQVATAYEIKTAFIIKLTKFVTWPESAFANQPNQFVIGIIGNDKFGNLFNPLIGKKIDGKDLVLKRFDDLKQIVSAHILYISPSEHNRIPEILTIIKHKDILTVSDTPGFAHKGCMINFINKKGTIGFEINIKAKNETNLQMSSYLLKLSKIIKDY